MPLTTKNLVRIIKRPTVAGFGHIAMFANDPFLHAPLTWHLHVHRWILRNQTNSRVVQVSPSESVSIEVQNEQRLAPRGISDKHSGQSFVVAAIGFLAALRA